MSERRSSVTCARCSATVNVEQSDATSAWTPDLHITATTAGWARVGGTRWICPACSGRGAP